MNITGSTKLTGLFGYPVSHTISPQMHNAGFKYLGLDIVYLPFSVHPKNLEAAVKSLTALGFIGINVTVPYKQKVMRFLDIITPLAKMIDSVNTILVKGKKLIGYNTDGVGFVKSLEKDYRYALAGKTMFLLGAGGAGRAVAMQSALSGLKCIYIADKLKNRARDLAKSVAKYVPSAIPLPIGERCPKGRVRGRQMREAIQESDIIVNATTIGLHPDDPVSIPVEWIPEGRLVYDLIYNPKITKLLKSVKGCRTVNGLGMLLYQGVSAFELWTGRKAPVGVMKKAISQPSAGV